MINPADISACIQSGSTRETGILVDRAIREKHPPVFILREGLAAGIIEMQKRYQRDEILDSELLISEIAFRAGLRRLKPVIETDRNGFSGTVITGTLEGDIRDTEKDLASCLMRSLGLNVIDLGTCVSSKSFIKAAVDEKARIIVCAVSLVSFLSQMEALVKAASQANIRPRTKILLSGGPVTEWFCKYIDADLYAPDLIQAADMAAEFCGRSAS